MEENLLMLGLCRSDVILLDQENGEKLSKEMELEPFLKEYKCITGFSLQLINQAECPDFIAKQSDGTELNIELSKIMCDLQ